MRTFIYAIHLLAVSLLFFGKSPPPVKKAKLTFIMQKPMTETFAQVSLPQAKMVKTQTPARETASIPEQKKTEKPPTPKPKPAQKKEVKTTPAKKPKETPVVTSKPTPKKALVTDEKKAKELESLKKIESLLQELQTPTAPSPAKKKTSSKSSPLPRTMPSIQATSLEKGSIAFDGEGFQQLLFDELQLPQAGEVELELEIRDGELLIAKIVQSQNDENLAYLIKKIPQIELGNCKKIAGLENGMHLRIIFCTKQI